MIDIVIETTAMSRKTKTLNLMSILDMSTKMSLIAEATIVAIASQRYFIFFSSSLKRKTIYLQQSMKL